MRKWRSKELLRLCGTWYNGDYDAEGAGDELTWVTAA